MARSGRRVTCGVCQKKKPMSSMRYEDAARTIGTCNACRMAGRGAPSADAPGKNPYMSLPMISINHLRLRYFLG